MTTSIARIRGSLGAAFKWARKLGMLNGNPLAGVITPRPQAGVAAKTPGAGAPSKHRNEVYIPSSDEVRQFLSANRDDPLYALWYAAYTLGLRPGELVALRHASLEVGASGYVERVVVHWKLRVSRRRKAERESLKSLDVARSQWQIISPRHLIEEAPKDDSYRELDAPHSTINVLIDQAERMAAEAARHPEWDPRWDGLLFRKANGEPYDPTHISGLYRQACKRAVLQPHRMYTARHYCASVLIDQGLSIKAVAAWLGHRTTKMVEETYGHLLRRSEGQKSPRELLDAVLDQVLDQGSGMAAKPVVEPVLDVQPARA